MSGTANKCHNTLGDLLPAMASAPAINGSAKRTTDTGQILYIEDDPFLGRLVSQKLTKLGHSITIVHDGQKGWEILQNQAFDLVLLDYQLPGMDGMTLLKKLADNLFTTPVVMVSGAGSLHVVVDAMRLGAADYVVKEMDGTYLDLLAPVVQRVLERKRLLEDKKRAEDQLAQKNEELEVLNQQKNRFFSIVAHDLRSPFSALMGLSDVFVRRVGNTEPEKLKELAETIHDSAKRVHSLVENLLSWSRLQMNKVNFEPETIPLHYIILDALDLAEIQAAEKEIKIEYSDCTIDIYADASMISTILRNILVNAIKFTPDQGKVKITAQTRTRNGRPFAEIAIRDSGVGMDQSQLDKLFCMGTQQSTAGTRGERGTGLGLLLCCELASRHEGFIEAESETGKGSEFRICLPVDGPANDDSCTALANGDLDKPDFR